MYHPKTEIQTNKIDLLVSIHSKEAAFDAFERTSKDLDVDMTRQKARGLMPRASK